MKKGDKCYNCHGELGHKYIMTRSNFLECFECYYQRRELLEELPMSIEDKAPPLGYIWFLLTNERKAQYMMEAEWKSLTPEPYSIVN